LFISLQTSLDNQNIKRANIANELANAFASGAVGLATGAFHTPSLLSVSGQLSPNVQQFTADNYKNARQISPGAMLVVGWVALRGCDEPYK
jgi:hypothetical protein